ncbi:MAG: hypothetical protein EOR22_06455 [Mesorhizobium sp.]|nr:MAG: hypothetical protein EOR22_06455 [Mesorhizobium sp.]
MIDYVIFGWLGGFGGLLSLAIANASKSSGKGWLFCLAWFVLLAMLTAGTKPASSKEIAYLVDGDLGGELLRYQEKAKIIGSAKIVVDGACLSACTMYLRKDWNLDICYTQSALFGFHKPYKWLEGRVITGISAITTADASWRSEFFDQMPAGIKAMLTGKQIPEPAAGDPTDRFVYIKARDVRNAVKRCPKDWASRYDLIDVQNVTTSVKPQ